MVIVGSMGYKKEAKQSTHMSKSVCFRYSVAVNYRKALIDIHELYVMLSRAFVWERYLLLCYCFQTTAWNVALQELSKTKMLYMYVIWSLEFYLAFSIKQSRDKASPAGAFTIGNWLSRIHRAIVSNKPTLDRMAFNLCRFLGSILMLSNQKAAVDAHCSINIAVGTISELHHSWRGGARYIREYFEREKVRESVSCGLTQRQA